MNYHKTLIARKEAAQKATPLPANPEDKPVQTSCDSHQTSREVKHDSELGAISKERDNSIKSKKENSHHKRHQECPEKPVQTGSQQPHDHETHSASAKKHHVRKGSTKKNATENSAVEEHSTANVKETSEQERVFLHDNQVKILKVLVLLCILISKRVLLMLFTSQNHLVQHFNIFFYQNKEKNSIAHSKCP